MKSILFLAATVWCTVLFMDKALSQDVQWASTLHFQYNHFSEDEYSGQELLGPPDAAPYGRMSKNAFRLKSDTAYGKVIVGYNNPMQVRQIIIVENFLPNRIAKVVVYDTAGVEHNIYEPNNEVINIPSRVLNINIEKTPYLVEKVALHINTIDKPGWAQIDAIGISEKALDKKKLTSMVDLDDLSFERTIRFAAASEKLSGNVNTAYGEAKPILSPDGKTLYFVRQNAPGNFAGKNDDQDIYFSNYINGEWSVAQNIGAPLNDKFPNGICSISADGNTIYVINAYNEDGTVENGISKSEKQSDGTWSQPKKLIIDDYYNNNKFQDYYMSASGNILLMAIEREDTYGNQDIYVSFKKEDDTWSAPINLGRIINTENIEYAPFLSSDEKILYFSSNGHSPQPESDIYYSRRMDDTWLRWSEPQNIGYEINTEGWDSYFAISSNSKYAYFVSTDGGITESGLESANKDIHRIPLDVEPEPENILRLAGKVYDKTNNMPVASRIEISAAPESGYEGFTMSSATNGTYSIKIAERGNFTITAEADGYVTYNDTLRLSEALATKEIEKNILLDPMTVGRKFQLEKIFFEQSSAELLPESYPELERLYRLMMNNPDMRIELGGHTDTRGYYSSNVRLSQDRADAVSEYLVNKGINKKRIETVGYGPSQPIAENDTEESRARNRRVEVKILEL